MIYKTLKLLVLAAVIAYAAFWAFSFRTYDMVFGVSFSPDYARYLGLDSEEAFDAILADLHPSSIRLAVPWSKAEPSRGKFDFSETDDMIRKAGAAGTKVVLTVGQKVPRWPECFIPEWVGALPVEERKKALLGYVEKTVTRYKDDPTVELWQVENEPYIHFSFGECVLYDQDFVLDEIALVNKLDPSRQVIVTDSGELSTYREASKAGDILGTTLYRTIRIGGTWVFRYDWIPPAFYKARSRLWGKDAAHFFVSELQAEPWFGDDTLKGEGILSEDKTFDPERFIDNVAYARKAGASRAYLWGVEWWYFMKVTGDDARYWEVAKGVFGN